MAKSFKRKVGGVVYYPDNPPSLFFHTIRKWIKARAPNGAIVYDNPDSLIAFGIPILDAIKVKGVWHRVPNANLSPKVAECTYDKKYLAVENERTLRKKIDGIFISVPGKNKLAR